MVTAGLSGNAVTDSLPGGGAAGAAVQFSTLTAAGFAALPGAGLLSRQHRRAPPGHPGGLGLVEASLSGLLILAGVRPGYVFLATLAYRVASCWLSLLARPPAYLLYRRRYGRPAGRRDMPGGAGSST